MDREAADRMFGSGNDVGGVDSVDGGLNTDRSTAETVIVTCALSGRAHAVSDTELTPTALDTGRFAALCGHVIAAAPLAEPDGEPCPECLELRRPPSRRRRGLRRLL
jgi:hypothetical protein